MCDAVAAFYCRVEGVGGGNVWDYDGFEVLDLCWVAR